MIFKAYWFFGYSGSGKTTLADAWAERLKSGHVPIRLDGDVLRQGVSKDLGFSVGDRVEQTNRAITIAAWEQWKGHIPICSFITPLDWTRDHIAERLEDVLLIWVDCPIEICEQRDPKGLYEQFRQGEIRDFTGLDSPFEEPEIPIRYPLLTLPTDFWGVEKCLKTIWEYDATK